MKGKVKSAENQALDTDGMNILAGATAADFKDRFNAWAGSDEKKLARRTVLRKMLNVPAKFTKGKASKKVKTVDAINAEIAKLSTSAESKVKKLADTIQRIQDKAKLEREKLEGERDSLKAEEIKVLSDRLASLQSATA